MIKVGDAVEKLSDPGDVGKSKKGEVGVVTAVHLDNLALEVPDSPLLTIKWNKGNVSQVYSYRVKLLESDAAASAWIAHYNKLVADVLAVRKNLASLGYYYNRPMKKFIKVEG